VIWLVDSEKVAECGVVVTIEGFKAFGRAELEWVLEELGEA